MAHTILVVDDEPALLRLMAFVLQKQGYEMVTATNGEEALEIVAERHPDLVVLDIMMPRRDGYQVAEEMRATPALADIPIVMLSAKAQEEDIERGIEAGVNTYVTKPFAPEQLTRIVAALLAGEEVPPRIEAEN
jgi:two-component system alkaline phosphatase synthesis response regulator PhoP